MARDGSESLAYMVMSATDVDAGKAGDAEVLMTGAVRDDPDNAAYYLFLGDAFAATRKYQPAIDAYNRYLERADKDEPDRVRAKKAISDLKRKM